MRVPASNEPSLRSPATSGCLRANKHGGSSACHRISGERGEVLALVLVRHGRRAEPKLASGLDQTQRELVVLVAVRLERFVESPHLQQGGARQREVSGVGLVEAGGPPGACKGVEALLKAGGQVERQRRGRAGHDRRGTDDCSLRRVAVRRGVGLEMGSQEARRGDHVIVEEQDQAAAGRVHAGIPGRRTASVGVPEAPEREADTQDFQHLPGPIVGAIDGDDHLVGVRGQCLPSECLDGPLDRFTTLVGGNDHRDSRRRHVPGAPCTAILRRRPGRSRRASTRRRATGERNRPAGLCQRDCSACEAA